MGHNERKRTFWQYCKGKQPWIFSNAQCFQITKKVKRKVQGVPQSQTAALPRPQEEEETDKSKQAQNEQTKST